MLPLIVVCFSTITIAFVGTRGRKRKKGRYIKIVPAERVGQRVNEMSTGQMQAITPFAQYARPTE